MNLFRILMACSLAVSLLVPVSSAEAAKGKKKKKSGKPTMGTVTAVQASETNKDTGTFSVKAQAKKKKGAPAVEGAESKFTFTKDTKVVTLAGKKKNRTETAASMADVKSGSRVIVSADTNGKAEKVMVLAGKKGKKKKQS
jgi:hypothetical protein